VFYTSTMQCNLASICQIYTCNLSIPFHLTSTHTMLSCPQTHICTAKSRATFPRCPKIANLQCPSRKKERKQWGYLKER
jgi:hypothetical protein